MHVLNTNKINEVIIAEFEQVQGIYLFGSFARDEATSTSDVDLAILMDQNIDISELQLWELSQKIAFEIKKDVDLIDLRKANTVLSLQILSSGKRIYTKDKTACEYFEMYAYSDYVRLNEERKEILDNIKTSGEIFNG